MSLVGELGVGVNAADAAFQGVAHFNVHPAVDALEGDLGTCAAVLRRVDGQSLHHLAGRRLLPDPARAHHLDAVKDA